MQKIAPAPSRRALTLLYFGLWGVAIASLTLSITSLLTESAQGLWKQYSAGFMLLLVFNTWYTYALLAGADWRDDDDEVVLKDSKRLMSIIIPCYNERIELFAETIHSVLQARGNKEVIIIDDGSPGMCKYLTEVIALHPNVKSYVFPENKGKREVLHYAVENLVSKDSFCCITIDSDTIVARDAFLHLAAELEKPGVGATTGDVLLTNEKQNVLTRMISSYYWIGLFVFKRAQGKLGTVVCCSGCLAAYRSDVIRDIMPEFHQQTFLGERCTHSEDRHLTNLTLRRGYRVTFVAEAKSYTETPSDLRSFCRQQLRWKRGYVRESIYTLAYAWRNQKRLFFQLLSWDLTATFLSLGLHVHLVLLLFLDPAYVMTTILPLWAVAVLLRYMYVLLKAPNKMFGTFVYGLLFEILMYWINIYALFTVKNSSWVTRTKPSAN